MDEISNLSEIIQQSGLPTFYYSSGRQHLNRLEALSKEIDSAAAFAFSFGDSRQGIMKSWAEEIRIILGQQKWFGNE